MQVARRKEFAEAEFHLVTGQQLAPSSGNVKIHTGVRPNSREMIHLYEQADVFVLPTRGDFGPTNAISEALAMSLPVVATGIGGIDEVIQDGTNGFIVPGDDPEALALRLIRLRDDSELRRSMAAASRRIAVEKLDAGKNALRVVEIMRRAALQMATNVKHIT
jgi:glycosyltransferase involved in cell wall biosynthesis